MVKASLGALNLNLETSKFMVLANAWIDEREVDSRQTPQGKKKESTADVDVGKR